MPAAPIDNSLLQSEQKSGRYRISAIDALRGLVIVLMALDHSRDFLGDLRIRPEAVDTTTLPLFFTRWVTHLCAPTFVFLAGVSAWLHGQKLNSQGELAWYLISRGAWLIFLEFTVIRFGLLFALTLGPGMFIVIAAIGASMILLGVCCFLPRKSVLLLGLLIIVGHNLLDGMAPDPASPWSGVWTLFMRPGYIRPLNLAVGYPILPWFGMMALGYGLSPFLTENIQTRRKFAFCLGVFFVVLFIGLRSLNQYGDTQRWDWQGVTNIEQAEAGAVADNQSTEPSVDYVKTLFSFLATSKYPPSLLFALMTLGPALILLAIFDWLGNENRVVRFFKVFGSVPLFFYVLHFYLLHLAAWALYWVFKGVLISPMHIDVVQEVPPEYGFNGPGWLVQVYFGWIVLVAVLYPLCIWFRKCKRNGSSRLWSYL